MWEEMGSIPGWGNKISHASAKKKKKFLKYKQTNKKEQFGEQQISTICIRSIRISFFFSKPPNIIESLVFARHCA